MSWERFCRENAFNLDKALVIKLVMMDPVDSEVMLVARVILSITLSTQKWLSWFWLSANETHADRVARLLASRKSQK